MQRVQCCFQLELWFLKRFVGKGVSGTRMKVYNAHKPPGWRRGVDPERIVLVSAEAMVSETVHGWEELVMAPETKVDI